MSDKYLDKPGISELWTATKKYVEDHSTPVAREIVVNAPIGAILPWSGSSDTVPSGWHICDGQDGTVDLRDKFILGAGSKHKQGEVGGDEEVTLTKQQLPAHQHLQRIDVASFTVLPFSSSTGTYEEQKGKDGMYLRKSSMVENGYMSVNSTYNGLGTFDTGNDQPHPNMPPYLTLYYIQKIGETPTDYVTEERAQEIVKEYGMPETDDTLSISEENVLGVTTPVNGVISQEDFDELPLEEQNKGLWIIPGDDGDMGGGLPSDGAEWADHNIYSTQEVRIGTWIDGKPLYRIVIETTIPSVARTTTTLATIPNCENIWNISGLWQYNTGQHQPLNAAHDTVGSELNFAYVFSYSRSQVRCTANGQCLGKKCWIAIEYTKTTDAIVSQPQIKMDLPQYGAASASDAQEVF